MIDLDAFGETEPVFGAEALEKVLGESDLIAVADKVEVSVEPISPAPTEPERVVSSEEVARWENHIRMEREVLDPPPLIDYSFEGEPDHYVSDVELQAELDVVMPGARVLQRTTQTVVTDVFINGGNYAPGQSRWVQTPTLSTAAKQAAIIKEIYG